MSLILALVIGFSPSIPFQNKPLLRNTFMSFLIPGSSQILYGSKVKGYAFVATEIFGFLSNFYYRHAAGIARQRYKLFAYMEADADPQNPDEDYWEAIERRRTREEYIQYLWRQARSRYPRDPEKQQEYVNRHMVNGNWSFPTLELWFMYRKMRRTERSNLENAGVMVGVIIANHIFSAIDAFVSTKLSSHGIGMNSRVSPYGASIELTYRF